jgi:single-strand DNA-binding protein
MPVRKTTSTTTTKPAPVRKSTSKTQPVQKSTARQSASSSRTTATPTTNRNRINKPNTQIGRWGNLGSDPEMRFSPNGTAVCSVSLAYTPYDFEKKEQGETVWYRCIGFNSLAESMARNLEKGMRIIAVGRPQLNEWEGDDGETRSQKEILLDAIGPDIRFADVSVHRIQTRGPRPSANAQYDDEEPF